MSYDASSYPRDEEVKEENFFSESPAARETENPDQAQFADGLMSLNLAAQLPVNQVHSNIDIQIVDHYRKIDTLRDYTIYVIKGTDSQGVIEASRRYNDFFVIRKVLVTKWPGCYIPPLPPKEALKNMEHEFIMARRTALDIFVRKIADLPHLHYSSEYQVFLRSMGGNLEQALKGYQRVQFEEMIQRYAQNFQELALIQQTAEAPVIVSRFRSFLYKISGRIRAMRAISKEVAKAKKKFYEGLAAFQTQVAVEYERDIIAEYQNFQNPKNVFCDPNNTQMGENMTKVKGAVNNQSVEYLDTWLVEEGSEVRTLLEAIDQKEKYEGYKRASINKQKDLTEDLKSITAGQFHLKTIFSSRSKDEIITEINQQIAGCSKEIEQLSTLIDMITLVISHIEIDKFKKSKSEKFYKIVGIAAQNELDNLSNATEYWTMISSKNNI